MAKGKGISPRAALITMIAVLSVMGIAGWAVLHWLLPQYWFRAYPAIPLVFMVFAAIITMLEVRWEKGVASGRTTQQRVSINITGAKMGKFLLSLILILLYWYHWNEQLKAFLLIFAIFYLVSLVLETVIFVSFTKKYNRKG